MNQDSSHKNKYRQCQLKLNYKTLDKTCLLSRKWKMKHWHHPHIILTFKERLVGYEHYYIFSLKLWIFDSPEIKTISNYLFHFSSFDFYISKTHVHITEQLRAQNLHQINANCHIFYHLVCIQGNILTKALYSLWTRKERNLSYSCG